MTNHSDSRNSAPPILTCRGWWGFFVSVLVVGGALFWLFHPATEREYEMAIRYVKGLNLPPGLHDDIELPNTLNPRALGRVVNLSSVVITGDGRIVALFKTSIGYKGNYEGYVYSNAPLRPSELSIDYYGRPIVFLKLLDKDMPVISKQLTSRSYEVFFDLN